MFSRKSLASDAKILGVNSGDYQAHVPLLKIFSMFPNILLTVFWLQAE